LFLIAVKQNRPHVGTEQRITAKRQCHCARYFFLDHAAAEQIQTGAAVFLRHVEHPESERFHFFVQWAQQMLRHFFALRTILPLQWNQLLVDKASHRRSQNLQFFS
jgi:hypothetical protein